MIISIQEKPSDPLQVFLIETVCVNKTTGKIALFLENLTLIAA